MAARHVALFMRYELLELRYLIEKREIFLFDHIKLTYPARNFPMIILPLNLQSLYDYPRLFSHFPQCVYLTTQVCQL